MSKVAYSRLRKIFQTVLVLTIMSLDITLEEFSLSLRDYIHVYTCSSSLYSVRTCI